MSNATAEFPAPGLIGAHKTFGVFGPAYEVVKPVRQLENGDWVMRVLILESGEETEYQYTAVLDDPEAA